MEFINLIDTQALEAFVSSGVGFDLLLLAFSMVMMIIGDSTRDYRALVESLEEEEEAIPCGSAEDCSLQEYLDGKVQLMERRRSGSYYARRKIEFKAATVQTGFSLVENAEYKAAEYEPELEDIFVASEVWHYDFRTELVADLSSMAELPVDKAHALTLLKSKLVQLELFCSLEAELAI